MLGTGIVPSHVTASLENHLKESACVCCSACRGHRSGGAICVLSRSVVSDSLWPHRLRPTRLLCPWDSPGKNTGVGCHVLLQGIFPNQGLNPQLFHLFYWQAGSLPLASSPGKPRGKVCGPSNTVSFRKRLTSLLVPIPMRCQFRCSSISYFQ